MSDKRSEEIHETDRRITIRWKVMLTLGAILIAMGLFGDWPPSQDSSLPDTSSFLIIVGGLLGAVGFLAALRRE